MKRLQPEQPEHSRNTAGTGLPDRKSLFRLFRLKNLPYARGILIPRLARPRVGREVIRSIGVVRIQPEQPEQAPKTVSGLRVGSVPATVPAPFRLFRLLTSSEGAR